MIKLVGNNWDVVLQEEYKKEYFKNVVNFVNEVYKEKVVFPPKNKILRALNLTDYDKVKVVILGQDPYHGVGEANGLAFAVSKGIKLPPSLQNIYKELESDLGIPRSNVGSLECWAREGVLLLNTVLTVEKDKAASHKNIGWEEFTDAAIMALNSQDRPIVFILWGAPAQRKKRMLNNQKHLILEAPHPSPLSAYRGFFGSRPFSQTNAFLEKNGIEPIDWQID